MKHDERLFDELGNVDEKYINEAENYTRKINHRITYILSGIAAVLVLTVGVGVWNNIHTENPVINPDKYKNDFIVSENSSKLQKISCDIDFGGMGFEGIITDNIEEIKGNNPWKEEWGLSELPVFNGTYETSEYSFEDMKNILSEISENYGADLKIINQHDGKDISQDTIDEVKEKLEAVGETFNVEDFYTPNEITAEICDFNVNINSIGNIKIEINKNDVPENCQTDPDDKEITYIEAKQRMKNFSEKYYDLLRFENPVPSIFRDYSYYGDAHTSCYIYDNSADHLTALLNYNFNKVQLYVMDENVTVKMYDAIPADSVIGMYPVIDEETAFDKLMNGDYVTSVWVEGYLPDGFTENDITFCGVEYRRTSDYQYWIPYYRYLIKLNHNNSNIPDNLDEYGGFYVPAVKSEYISNIDIQTAFN